MEFSHIIFVEKIVMFVRRDKINEKVAGNGSIEKICRKLKRGNYLV